VFKNILILCTANICRSPLAEGILRAKLQDRPEVQVHSAGVAAIVGAPPHPIVLDMLRKEKINTMRKYRAQQCDLGLLRQADLVLVMEQAHLKWLSRSYPQFHGRSFLMGHWHERAEVPDPIGQPREVFESVRDLILDYADDWVARVSTERIAR
jgi:protein-tyrosine phosphatase